MLDLRQNNEPVYYGADQIQRNDQSQLQDVEERHRGMQGLEKDIVQLHEIHRDFAELVNSHNPMIDNIEASVSKTEDQVIIGANRLADAVQLQSAARRKKILCCLLLFIIIVIGIVIGVVIYLAKKK